MLGLAALAQGEYDEARRSLGEGIAALREAGDREYEAWALAGLGAAALGKGERAAAQAHLRAALKTAVEIRAHMPLLHLMPIIPLLWADADEPDLKERAIALTALAKNQPFVAKSQLFEDVAGRRVKAATANLPPEVVEAAQSRGRALDWWETAEELLDELREPGWASAAEPDVV